MAGFLVYIIIYWQSILPFAFSNLELHWKFEWENNYSKAEIYMLFLQNSLMIFEEAMRSPDEEELTAP